MRKKLLTNGSAFMLNTGLRTGELLRLLNSDIDLENRVMHLQQGVKEISKREGTIAEPGREVRVGKLKSATSRRDVPLNGTAVAMIERVMQGKLLRPKYTPCSRRERRLHKTGQFPEEILPHPQSSRD